MSTTTPNLGLFKYDTTTDGKEVFSIQTALNNNWDIIDNIDLLPDQTDKSGYLLTTNGSVASWGETEEVACVIETYVNGTSWYRVYSDGWCEQGGVVTVSTANTDGVVTLLKSLDGNNYAICVNRRAAATTTTFASVGTRGITTNGFAVYSSLATSYNWSVCGYVGV